jgi:hypothetical protein
MRRSILMICMAKFTIVGDGHSSQHKEEAIRAA